jgi:hypothetical protein
VNTAGGVLTSKSVDKVSASYDVSGIINPDAGSGTIPATAASSSGGGRCSAPAADNCYEVRVNGSLTITPMFSTR